MNVPNVPFDEIKGVLITKWYSRVQRLLREARDPRGRLIIRWRFRAIEEGEARCQRCLGCYEQRQRFVEPGRFEYDRAKPVRTIAATPQLAQIHSSQNRR